MRTENKAYNYKGELVPAPNDLSKILLEFGDRHIVWSRSDTRHRVRYGLSCKTFIGPDRDLKACHEFGLCCRHHLECEGKL
jgi:hypothetical protein